jgi:thymidylate synthase (FAD)
MKVILNPTVTIIGHTKFIEHPVYKIPSDGTDAEQLGAFAAKSCYNSFGESGRSCIDNQSDVISHAHGSVLEHSYVTMFVEGISRALSLEMNRHRTFGISQRSTRYTSEDDGGAIVLEPYYAGLFTKYKMDYKDWMRGWVPEGPPDYCYTEDGASTEDTEKKLIRNFLNTCQLSFDSYKQQVEWLMSMNPNNLQGFDLRKWSRGKARNSLVHCLETKCVYTANHRALRWFLECRSDRHAEPEIRRLANVIIEVIRPIAPVYYADAYIEATIDGISEWKFKHRKV